MFESSKGLPKRVEWDLVEVCGMMMKVKAYTWYVNLRLSSLQQGSNLKHLCKKLEHLHVGEVKVVRQVSENIFGEVKVVRPVSENGLGEVKVVRPVS